MSLPEFAGATSALLLPYIALFSQLGLQTGSRLGDVLSLLISLGSPTWTCASIGVTVLFRRAIRKRFDHLRAVPVSCPIGDAFLEDNRVRHERDGARYAFAGGPAYLEERYNGAQIILQGSLQAPISLSTREGFLEDLIASPRNHWWWVAASEKLTAWQRRLELTFITQSVVAVLAWLLAIIADFWTM